MFEFQKMIDGKSNPTIMDWPVAANQTITRGALLQLTGGLAAVASAGSTSILGVAQAPKTTGASVTNADTVPVLIARNAVFKVGYTGSTKTSLSSADNGTAFDINADAKSINLDDTTGGMCKLFATFDNTAKTAHVVISSAALVY